jgi:hypothetical protein
LRQGYRLFAIDCHHDLETISDQPAREHVAIHFVIFY